MVQDVALYFPMMSKQRIVVIEDEPIIREAITQALRMTGNEVRNQARFDDSVGIFPEFLDAYGVVVIPTTGRYFQVPYGILVPKLMDNLLVAGRSVSGDKISLAALRQMMCCTVTGQAAGVAAAVSVKDNVSVRNVDITHVQNALTKQGVRID